MYEIKVKAAFEAAHRIVGYPGKCDRLHGHNWTVEAAVCGEELDALGMLIDFKELKAALKEILAELDHQYLNELPPFTQGTNPTAENIAQYIFTVLEEATCLGNNCRLAAVTVWESPDSCVTYRR
ncbi:MAG: 6-carboxytetrahydropterin synthase QueD [Selenomonadaceae bacterium]|nr:6-carboxytetrahydropterin synthase QueD [Selenomonadaceae bacterium]